MISVRRSRDRLAHSHHLPLLPVWRRSLTTGRDWPGAAVLLLAFALTTGCGDSAGPPEDRVTTASVAGGNEQEGTVAAALPQPIVVRALDAQSNPVRGARIEWLVVSGGGTVTAIETETDEDGRASATWTLGTTAGAQTATAEIGIATATFTATGVAGLAVSVSVTPSPIVLDALGATAQAQIVAMDAHNNAIEGRAPTWESTDTDVATVDASGLVSAVSPGSATIRATLDGVTGEADVNVDPQPAAVLVDPPAVQLAALGAMQQFSASAEDRNGNPVPVPATQFVWSSSNSVILTVSATGLATAQGNGIAQVQAALGALTGIANVTISQVATSLVVSPKTDTLTTAQPSVQLVVAALDANNQPIPAPAVTWTSANTGIATVSITGLVQAVANGVVRIHATSGTKSDSATITVRLNAAPAPVADSLGAAQNTQLVVAAPGLLANDTVGIPPGTITSFGAGSLGGAVTTYPVGTTAMFGTGGSLTVNANGSLTFMPSTGFTGSFTFQYRMQNIEGARDATVKIDVGIGPTATDDAYSTPAGVTLTVTAGSGVRANDNLGFPPAVVASIGGGSLPGNPGSFPAGSNLAFGIGGFIRVNPDGSLSFTPPSGVTTFTVQYRLANGAGTSDATITITIN